MVRRILHELLIVQQMGILGLVSRCDELAAARDWAALRAICPNTSYLNTLRRR